MSNQSERNEEEPINRSSFKRVQLLQNTEAIEAVIQQAIETCWNALPSDRRNAESLQMEMMRLTSEKINQYIRTQLR